MEVSVGGDAKQDDLGVEVSNRNGRMEMIEYDEETELLVTVRVYISRKGRRISASSTAGFPKRTSHH